ncbi:Uncharacterised protein [Chryseobacterium carnipullorum]|uniref:Uncharacterized protein n=1 Tax=Chryseobacterium carnipullorum TaxID=1124835 RepID=A0A376DW43_CHRCU|nr:Uncharacterised protein [Chryseobacterium carnipullorum]
MYLLLFKNFIRSQSAYLGNAVPAVIRISQYFCGKTVYQ